MSDGFVDPGPPPPARERLKAKNLVGQNCLILPTGIGEWDAKPATATDRAQPAQEYVECDVWTLDRQGIVASESGVRISWYRAVPDLKSEMGKYLGCRPTEDTDKSNFLARLPDEIRPVAKKVCEELIAKKSVDALGGVEDGTEEF